MPYAGNENLDNIKVEEVIDTSSDSSSTPAPETNSEQKSTPQIKLNISPQNLLVPDIYEKLPKEDSFYIDATKESIEKLICDLRSKEVTIPDDLLQNIQLQILNYGSELISMANNAGQMITGFEKVESTFKKGRNGLYITSSNEGSSSRVKLQSSFERNCFGEIIDIFDIDLLIKATGKKNPVHIFVEYGGLSRKIIVQVNKYRSLSGLI